MTVSIRISLACGDYARTRGLRDGTVQIEGLDLTYLSLPPAEIFWRMLRFEEFDASEMSLSAHIMGVSRGDSRFVAIPVFPSRIFRHSFIFVNRGAGIEAPHDLRGKRVGVPEYHMTAAMFIRGMLADEYGVQPSDLTWFQGGLEAPGRVERMQLDLPDDLRVNHVPDRTLDEMLDAGDIDALFSATVPPSMRAGSPRVARLFGDPKRAEIDYFQRTKIFPIMHTVAVRREVVDRYPWLPTELRKAFETAKAVHYERLQRTHADPGCGLPFAHYESEETFNVFGADFWPYGVRPNRPTLEAAVRYSHEQHLSARLVSVEELFDPSASELSVE